MLEYTAAFRNHNRAQPHYFCSQNVGNIAVDKFDVPVADKAVFRLQQSADRTQGGGFSRPVGPQQGHNAAFFHIQADATKDLYDIIINHFNIIYFQHVFRLFFVHNGALMNLPAASRGVSLKVKFILSQQAAGN